MTRTTMGQLLVNEALPDDMKDHDRVLDKKGMNNLLRDLAIKHPEKYAEVSKKLNDIGRTVATEFGGYTFGVEHLRKSKIGQQYQTEIKDKMTKILSDDRLTPEQRHAAIVRTVGGYQQKQIDDIYNEAVKGNNPLALQVVSGSRGNKMNLASLLGSDMLYADHRDEVIPLPVLSSYSQGLKPSEYWASTYGARRGTMATKFATQDAGFLSKQLNQVAHRLMIVGDDDTRDLTNRGLPVDTDDSDNEGALLAKDFGPYKRNTAITPKIAKHLKSIGHDRILVRSPLVGGSPDGGVYARDVGIRERGTLPGRGEQVGLTAAQALSEPLSQGQLSAKHSGGVAGQEKAVGGFAYINQLIQVPKRFKGGASHSEQDGTVTNIDKAPAGGHFVFVNDQKHYVPEGVDLKVKKGDQVEAGDVLSDGFPNPAIVTEHKGVGEGRRYFVNAFRQAMLDAGMKVHRRNVELLSRGLVNHVRLTDEMGDHVPDDVVPYSTVEQMYEPREDHEVVTPTRAIGKYLEKPVLHYSIGTKVRPSVLKELQHFGVDNVAVHKDPPPFQPHMVRGMYSLQNDPDWMTRMYGSGLKGSVLDATHHGAVSNEEGTSFVPALSRAVDFGRIGTVRQPDKGTAPPAEGQPFGDPRTDTQSSVSKPSLDLPKPAEKKEPKSTGFFSGLFKASEDEIIKEAATCLAKPVHAIRAAMKLRQAPVISKQMARTQQIKTAEEPQVSSTLKPSTGSSTVGAGGAGKPTPNPPVPHTPPNPIHPAVNPTPLAPAKPFQPEAPGGIGSVVPGSQPSSSTPGQVHPDRTPSLSIMPHSQWSGSQMSETHGANPNAFSEGYTPGHGLMDSQTSPEMLEAFVRGGGREGSPGSGFGGHFGDMTRLGSLLDTRAVGTLTQGAGYVRNNNGGHGHDDLMGGMPQSGVSFNGQTAQPQVNAPAAQEQKPKQTSLVDDVLSTFKPSNALATAPVLAGTSILYRRARQALGYANEGGLFAGARSVFKKVLGPLGLAVEAREGLNQTHDEAMTDFEKWRYGDVDVSLPFGLHKFQKGTNAARAAEMVMNPGKWLGGLGHTASEAVGIHPALRERAQTRESDARVSQSQAGLAATSQAEANRLEDVAKVRPLTQQESETLTRTRGNVIRGEQENKSNLATSAATSVADTVLGQRARTTFFGKSKEEEYAEEVKKKQFGVSGRQYLQKIERGAQALATAVPGQITPDVASDIKAHISELTYESMLSGTPTPRPEEEAVMQVQKLLEARGHVERIGDKESLADIDKKLDSVGRTPDARVQKRQAWGRAPSLLRPGFTNDGWVITPPHDPSKPFSIEPPKQQPFVDPTAIPSTGGLPGFLPPYDPSKPFTFTTPSYGSALPSLGGFGTPSGTSIQDTLKRLQSMPQKEVPFIE